MKKLLVATLMIASIFFLGNVSVDAAQGKSFTTEELSQYNGIDGAPAYYGYEGKVYDVTGSDLWKQGEHYGLQAGQDLTGKMGDAPHNTEVFAPFQVVGTYEVENKQAQPVVADMNKADESDSAVTPKSESRSTKWYQGRIRILGFSILGWTGIFLGVFFVLTFSTCFSMPWSKLSVPWKGSKIGPDPLDKSEVHMKWTSVHKYFVWWTVIIGIIHGIIGFLQMAGIYL